MPPEGNHVTDRPDDLRKQMLDQILDCGCVIQFVPADAQSVLHGAMPYAYTAGRTLSGRPEFLVTGLTIEMSKAFLNELIRLDSEHGGLPIEEAVVGFFATLDIDGVKIKVKVISASPSPLLGAMAVFGATAVTALQALWPRKSPGLGQDYPSPDDKWPDQPIHPFGRTPLVDKDPYA